MAGHVKPETSGLAQGRLSRRTLLRMGGVTALAATAGGAGPGCATLPPSGRTATRHTCDCRLCRFHLLIEGEGRCTLELRVAGGRP